jgi:hypothetical protein
MEARASKIEDDTTKIKSGYQGNQCESTHFSSSCMLYSVTKFLKKQEMQQLLHLNVPSMLKSSHVQPSMPTSSHV